jgi:hypothetical protein
MQFGPLREALLANVVLLESFIGVLGSVVALVASYLQGSEALRKASSEVLDSGCQGRYTIIDDERCKPQISMRG